MHLYGFVDLHSRCITFTVLITILKTYTSLNKWHPCMLSQIQCTTNGWERWLRKTKNEGFDFALLPNQHQRINFRKVWLPYKLIASGW